MDNIVSLDAICLEERDCGCHLEWDRCDVMIVFCPLHNPENVADLLAALEVVMEVARAAIAQAKGEIE